LLPLSMKVKAVPLLLLFFRRVLPLLVLVAALPAAADVHGIPADQRFPTAHFPYARQVDGCTSWRQPARFAQGFGQVDFNGACQAHDQCFHTLGRTWGECNQAFLSALRHACARDLKRQRLEQGRAGEPDMQALHLCFDIADLYLARVQEPAAIRRYELAQRQQRAYLAHVRGAIQRLFVTVLRRPATEDEEADVFGRIEAGMTLGAVAKALASSKADRKAALVRLEPPSELPAIDEASLVGLAPLDSAAPTEGGNP
jgi:hypothetical protein